LAADGAQIQRCCCCWELDSFAAAARLIEVKARRVADLRDRQIRLVGHPAARGDRAVIRACVHETAEDAVLAVVEMPVDAAFIGLGMAAIPSGHGFARAVGAHRAATPARYDAIPIRSTAAARRCRPERER
jgi:hypothetical protein